MCEAAELSSGDEGERAVARRPGRADGERCRVARACSRSLRDGHRRSCRGRARVEAAGVTAGSARARPASAGAAGPSPAFVRRWRRSNHLAPLRRSSPISSSKLGTTHAFSGHRDEASRTDRRGAHPRPAPRARRAVHVRPHREGRDAKRRGTLPGGSPALRRRRGRLGPDPRANPARDDLGDQPGRSLHDRRPARKRGARRDHAGAGRRWGLRGYEAGAAGNLTYVLTMAGRLEEAERLGTELLESGGDERPRSCGHPRQAGGGRGAAWKRWRRP